MYRIFAFVVLSLCLVGCEKADVKTESMLRIERANQSLQDWLDQMSPLLTDETIEKPEQHLNDLFFIHETLLEADKVYPKAHIESAEPPFYLAFKQTLFSLNPALAQLALTRFREVIQRSQEYREQLALLKGLPTGSALASQRRANQFEQQMDECCITDLYKISLILEQSERRKYHSLIAEIDQVESTILALIEQGSARPALETRLEHIAESISLSKS